MVYEPVDEIDSLLRCLRQNGLTWKRVAKAAWQILDSWGTRGTPLALVAELCRAAETRDVEYLNAVLCQCAADRATWSALWKAAWSAQPASATAELYPTPRQHTSSDILPEDQRL